MSNSCGMKTIDIFIQCEMQSKQITGKKKSFSLLLLLQQQQLLPRYYKSFLFYTMINTFHSPRKEPKGFSYATVCLMTLPHHFPAEQFGGRHP